MIDEVDEENETSASTTHLGDDEDDDDEEPTEQSRLIGGGEKPRAITRVIQSATSHADLVVGAIGLLTGLVKPIQRALIGTQEAATGGWSGIGGGLMLLAAAYATVDMLSVGAGVRAGERK